MPQVEFGSLYKFVASVGLALVVAAVTVPWILLQSTDVLLISKRKIKSLPESAGNAVEHKQLVAAWAQDNLPIPVFILLAVLGISLLIWALSKWTPSQKRTDASEEIALQKSEAEFRQLTLEEVAEKLEEEVTEDTPEASAEGVEASRRENAPQEDAISTLSVGTSKSRPYLTTRSQNEPRFVEDHPVRENDPEDRAYDPHERSRRLIDQLRSTENKVATVFEGAFGGAFQVKRDMEVSSGKSRGQVLDILLDPEVESRAQLGVEIKRYGSHVMPNRLGDFVTRLAIATKDLSAGTVYTGARGRPKEAKSSGVLVIVLSDQHFTTNAMRIQRDLPPINSVLKRPIGVILTTDHALDQVTPQEWRDGVSSAWANPDDVAQLGV